MKTKIRFLVLCCLVIVGSRSFSQDKEKWFPEITYTKGRLGHALQDPFYSICKSCELSKRSNREASRDYIPREITDFLKEDLAATEVTAGGVAGSAIFKNVFDAAAIQSALNLSSITPVSIIPFPNVNPMGDLLVEDFNWFQYNRTCAGLLHANFSGGATIPIANIQASVKKETERKSSISVYGGWFESPVIKLKNDPASSTSFHSLVWEFYKDNTAVAEKLYLLKAFKGAVLGKSDDMNDYRTLEVAGKINLAASVGQGTFQGQTKLNFSKGFQGMQWTTIIYNTIPINEREKFFTQLPTRSDVVTKLSLKSNQISVKSEGNALLAEQNPHTHYFEVPGYSLFLTDESRWEFGTNNFATIFENDATLDVIPNKNANGELIGAIFKITGTPKSNLFQKNDATKRPGSVTINYKLQTVDKVGGAPITIDVLQSISTSSHPVPDLAAFVSNSLNNINLVDGKTIFNARWETQVNFVDTDNQVRKVNGTAATLNGNAFIRFPDNSQKQVSAQLICEGATYRLKVESESNEFRNGINFSASKRFLPFEATFEIPLIAGGNSKKLIRTSLEFPVENVPTPVGPAGP
jgi:hypothetical protein